MGRITVVHLAWVAFGYFAMCLKIKKKTKQPTLYNKLKYKWTSSFPSLWTIIQDFRCWKGASHHDTNKHAAERADLQKKGRVKSRGNTIFCSLSTYFLSQWFSLEPRLRRGMLQLLFGSVWFFFFLWLLRREDANIQCELPRGEMDQVAPFEVYTCAGTQSRFSLWRCAESYWSLLHDIEHLSKWQ